MLFGLLFLGSSGAAGPPPSSTEPAVRIAIDAQDFTVTIDAEDFMVQIGAEDFTVKIDAGG